jgi:hypothetical protein
MLKNKPLKVSAVIVLISASLLLSGCAKSNEGANTTSGNNDALVADAKPTGEATFGSSVKLKSGVEVAFGALASFKPSPYASNVTPGAITNKFEVTVTNNGAEALDPTKISFTQLSGSNICTDLLDGDGGISGALTETLAKGATGKFTYGVSCIGSKQGDPLFLTATIGADVIKVSGALN